MELGASKQFLPELYRSYLRVLARVFLRSSGPLQQKIDASDVVQETLLQAFRALPRFRGTTDKEFAAWLRAILANKLADAARHFNRRKRDAALEQSFRETLDTSAARFEKLVPADDTSPSQGVLRYERACHLAESLAHLPEEQRMAVEFHHLDGCSLQETAQRMTRSTASVAGLLRRGLKGLHESLKDKEHDLA